MKLVLSAGNRAFAETKNGTPQVISLDDGQGIMMRILKPQSLRE